MVEILDANGEPLRRSDLKEPQTSKVALLQHEFQGHPSRGLTPSRLARILEDAEQGHLVDQAELFEDMEEKDPHIACEMGKRRRALTGLEWDIVPPTNPSAKEKKAANELHQLMAEIPNFEDVLFDLTDGIGKGFACQEIEWHLVENQWLPKSITHRPQAWFRVYRSYREEIRLRDNSADGAPLQPFGWIQHRHQAKSGYLPRNALFRVLVWPYLFKNYSLADLAEFLEIYGIPLRLGKYAPGASEADKATLLRALVNIGHNAAGIMPAGMEIEFEKAAEGDPKSFELMIDWCERSVSKAVLGVTLTTQADRGSNTNALGNVHNELRKDLRDSDAKQVESTLNRDLLYPIAVLNGLVPDGSLRRAPRILFNTKEPEDLTKFSEALPALVKMGVRVPRKWTQEQLGIPEPEDGEDVLHDVPEPEPEQDPTAAVGKPPAKASAVAAAKGELSTGRSSARTDGMTALLERQADPHVQALVEKVRDLVEHAGSLDEVRDRLVELAGDMPVDQLAELMGQALVAADLSGRSDVEDELDRGDA